MKKRNHFFILILISLAVIFLFFETQTKVANATMNASVKIPEESIRLRILANSNSVTDQKLKREIRDEVNAQITTWVDELSTIEEAREIIRKQLPAIEAIVQDKLDEAGVEKTFSVELNKVAFPTKMYGDYIYPAGKYEAVLITLGEGEGKNWWCVLFPPLCFLDFENGDAVKENKDGQNDKAEDTASADETEKNAFAAESEEAEGIQTKFFVIELFDSLVSAVGSLFS
ncbi:stage II sporulation protein R [Fictibacillus phosphorivorans]|uniref:stage II sporulation protein R n=1 Tax=Fictibacillus phosphorivorans TaxID=1221500 RepID=UPI00203A72E4|nr:stage II sporulation protein R [Fictibacillus phosphorivorans]MCM3718400.1 stage II sporulation protein R [Fictibacillus phosphorivorans]MCM3776024.1 stage II sporulation protein R [Fictibacillus phosphorivorans]